jgi:hypothetical protein
MSLLNLYPPRHPPPHSWMHTGTSVLGTLPGRRCPTPGDWRIYVCMTKKQRCRFWVRTLPVIPLLSHVCTQVHRFSQPYLTIGSRNPTWQTLPNSGRLTDLQVGWRRSCLQTCLQTCLETWPSFRRRSGFWHHLHVVWGIDKNTQPGQKGDLVREYGKDT